MERKNSKKKILVNDLRWFDSTKASDLFYLLEEKEKSSLNYKLTVDGIKKEIEILKADIQKTNEYIKTLLNPFNWFDNNQKKYRQRMNGLVDQLSTKQKHKKNVSASLSKTSKAIKLIKSDISKHESFNRQNVNDELISLDREIVTLTKEVTIVSSSRDNVDVALKPVIAQINDYESSISTAKGKINKAQSFDSELDSADNSYERAMIHEKCEKTFGDGSPKKIIRRQEGAIRAFERDLEKTKKRAIQIGKKASLEIKKIIIDGNNMCYEGHRFVGLAPLISATDVLHDQYNIIIVFDSAIRSQIRANDQEIREKFNGNIKVHVVASKQLADETILEIASSDDLCYILSNDRFGEYMEKDAVKNNRLIKHEVVDGKVIIHDLNVNVGYD